ncbi:hypothetical protein EON83_07605 [bacterium]|nr:MAG: hypothetical protein EON83_07605 [bacterium]
MMNESYLMVRRHPYEEPDHTQLEFIVSNGSFTGGIDFYCGVDDIANIGTALRAFPRSISDEYVYEYGSPVASKRFYRHFRLRAYTIDRSGHCALQITINLNRDEPEEGICRFSMRCEPWSLERLGNLFLAFARLEHLEFKWVPNTEIEEMYTEYQGHW